MLTILRTMVAIPVTSVPAEPVTAAAATTVPAGVAGEAASLVLDFGALLAALLGGAAPEVPATTDDAAESEADAETETATTTKSPTSTGEAIAAAAAIPAATAPVPAIVPAATSPGAPIVTGDRPAVPEPGVAAPTAALQASAAPLEPPPAPVAPDAPVAEAGATTAGEPLAGTGAAPEALPDATPAERAPTAAAPTDVEPTDPVPAAVASSTPPAEAAPDPRLAAAPETRVVAAQAAARADAVPERTPSPVTASTAPIVKETTPESGTQGESPTGADGREGSTAEPAPAAPPDVRDAAARTSDAPPARHGDAPAHPQHPTTATREGTRPVADTPPPPLPMRDVEQLVRLDALRPQRMPDGGEMRLEVTSPSLGQIDVHVTVRNDGVNATLLADQAGAREALTAQRPTLEAALGRANLRLDGFNVGTGPQQHQSPQPDAQQSAPGWRPAALPATPTPTPTTTAEPVRTVTGGLSLRA